VAIQRQRSTLLWVGVIILVLIGTASVIRRAIFLKALLAAGHAISNSPMDVGFAQHPLLTIGRVKRILPAYNVLARQVKKGREFFNRRGGDYQSSDVFLRGRGVRFSETASRYSHDACSTRTPTA
jgi:hypothetical protein